MSLKRFSKDKVSLTKWSQAFFLFLALQKEILKGKHEQQPLLMVHAQKTKMEEPVSLSPGSLPRD